MSASDEIEKKIDAAITQVSDALGILLRPARLDTYKCAVTALSETRGKSDVDIAARHDKCFDRINNYMEIASEEVGKFTSAIDTCRVNAMESLKPELTAMSNSGGSFSEESREKIHKKFIDLARPCVEKTLGESGRVVDRVKVRLN